MPGIAQKAGLKYKRAANSWITPPLGWPIAGRSTVTRRKSLVLLALSVAILAVAWQPAAAQQTKLDAATIKAGLRTTSIEEEGFVDRVLTLMDEGTLPQSMVHGTFFWATKKPRHKFQYFKFAMIVRASRIGVRL
jgi:hypothetical protein